MPSTSTHAPSSRGYCRPESPAHLSPPALWIFVWDQSHGNPLRLLSPPISAGWGTCPRHVSAACRGKACTLSCFIQCTTLPL
ncbi:hypothetical protein FKM82_019971 [Ascaphus truei]